MRRVCVVLLLATAAWGLVSGSSVNSTTSSAALFDFLLWPLKHAPQLRLHRPEPYFSKTHLTVTPDEPADFSEGNVERLKDAVLPGGVLLTEASINAVSSLRRVAAMRPQQPADDPWRKVKLAVISGSQLLLVTKGALDDNDHFCLGDYGNEYGEYRWGIFSRFIQRMIGHTSPQLDTYFTNQLQIFSTPVNSVRVELEFPHSIHESVVSFRTRKGRAQQMHVDDLKRAVAKDLQFSLAVHPERMTITLESAHLTITFRNVESVSDYSFHKKKHRPWTVWSSYFGDSMPQPLVVVAQTIREKSLMVDDDLSDFYKGRVTASVPEGAVKVSVETSGCKEFEQPLKMHLIACSEATVTPDMPAAAPVQSPLYVLAAKEKLSGDLGAAAESSLKTMFARTGKPWPSLAVLHIEEDEASFELFEERGLTSGHIRSLVNQLPHGVDIVHVHSCDIPPKALSALVPGGLVLVEGLDCADDRTEFDGFVAKARQIGHLAIGRRIGVIVKSGRYQPNPRRAVWPQKTRTKTNKPEL